MELFGSKKFSNAFKGEYELQKVEYLKKELSATNDSEYKAELHAELNLERDDSDE